MHQNLLQFQTCQTFSMSKTKSQDCDSLKSPRLRPQDTLTKLPISREYFWALSFSGQEWYKQLWTKRPTFQNNPHTRREASTWRVIYGMHRCPEKTNREHKKKEKRKIDCHVMHLKKKTRLSLNENQEKQKMLKKWWKTTKTQIIPSLARIYSSV